MNKLMLALAAGLFLATGTGAFAQTSALDLVDAPARGSANLTLFGGSDRDAGIDYRPTAAIGVTGTIAPAGHEYSAGNGFGDHSPAPQILR